MTTVSYRSVRPSLPLALSSLSLAAPLRSLSLAALSSLALAAPPRPEALGAHLSLASLLVASLAALVGAQGVQRPMGPAMLEQANQAYTCPDWFDFTTGAQMATPFQLEPALVGPGTAWPDGTVQMAFARFSLPLGNEFSDLVNYNASIVDDNNYSPGPNTLGYAWGLANMGGQAPSGFIVNMIQAQFPAPFFTLAPSPPTNFFWLVVTYNGVRNATNNPFPPRICVVDNGVIVTVQNPFRAENGYDYFFRPNAAAPWQQAPIQTLGGAYMALNMPFPTPSATPSTTASGTTSRSASATRSSVATGTTTVTASMSATMSSTTSSTATATSTMTPSPSPWPSNVTQTLAVAAPPDVGAIAGGAIGGILGVVALGFLALFCMRASANGEGFWAARAVFGPKQEKDRSIKARIESRRNSLKGVEAPAGHYAAKIPKGMEDKGLGDMASIYDQVYGDKPADPEAAAAAAAAAAREAAARADTLRQLAEARDLMSAGSFRVAGIEEAPAPAPAPASAGVAARAKQSFGPTQSKRGVAVEDVRVVANPAAGLSAEEIDEAARRI